MPFRIHSLDPAPFEPLFHLSDEQLASLHAVRVLATHKPGFPCRVSLLDAEPGEDLLLLHFEHQPAPTPFRAGHAIYVRKGARRSTPEPNQIPDLLRTRTLSLRAFDPSGMIVAATLTPGTALEPALNHLLEDASVATVHIHNAAMGCYLARADRA